MPNSIKACNRNNHTYHIDVIRNKRKQEFCICLFYREYNDGSPKQHNVAVIDGKSQSVVFKKLFEKGQPSKKISLDYYNSLKLVDNNWESFADKYEQNHRP